MNILTKLRANIDRIADAVEGGVTPTPTPSIESDFTTAEVTIFNNKKNKVLLVLPQVYDDQIYVSDDYQNGTYTVPLYKGQLILQAIALTSETYTTNVTGSIIKDANEFIITGDGVIQIGVASENPSVI